MPEESAEIRFEFKSERCSPRGLREALRHREHLGGSLAFHLATAGQISSQDLFEFLVEKTGFPTTSEAQMGQMDARSMGLLPVEIMSDAPCLPLEDNGLELCVAVCDPEKPHLLEDLEWLAAQPIKPYLISVEHFAELYELHTGRPWRAKKGLRQHKTDGVAELLKEITKLDEALARAVEKKASTFIIEIKGEEITLSRSRRTAAATLERADAPILAEAQRPKIRGKGRGASRHYLDAVQEGESVLVTRKPRVEPSSEPKIIIDMGLLNEEPEEKTKPVSNSIIIDPALLMPEPKPEPEPEQKPKARPARPSTEIRLGTSSEDSWEFDIDVEIEDLELGFDELNWGSDLLDIAPPPEVTEEAKIPIDWFSPEDERTQEAPSRALREALSGVRSATSDKELFAAVCSAIRTHYERAVVFKLALEEATVVAYESPRTWFQFVADSGAPPRLSSLHFPALEELRLADAHAYHGPLLRTGFGDLTKPLAGGPPLLGVFAPIVLNRRVALLCYGDAGPGRDAEKAPSLWALLRRHLPALILSYLLGRKRQYRWEVMG